VTDVLVRGGTLVLPGVFSVRADVAIEDGRIETIAPEAPGTAREEIDARGLLVLPGAIDAHVHFNDPGRAEWEGWASGTAALAAGGATACVEMPLNAHPPTVDGAAFDAKVGAAERGAVVDFALWGGLVPGDLDRLDELAERGVVGFKAFMCDTGIEDFGAVGDDVLGAGMERAAELGLPVAVHAERPQRLTSMEGGDWRAWAASRPVEAELEAIERALELAQATGCSLHVVHVSSGAGVARVAEARARGVDATCETCPHYLVLTEEDMERLGTASKCAPPLRPEGERAALWSELEAGNVALVGSDHSPCPPAMKAGDFAAAWGGIAGAQTTLALLLDEGYRRGLPLASLANLVTGGPARRLHLRKGRLEPGADADLALVKVPTEHTLSRADLHDRHRANPFAGRVLAARVVRTLLRGRTVYHDGLVPPEPHGRLLVPDRQTGAP
jgi:allantoinase